MDLNRDSSRRKKEQRREREKRAEPVKIHPFVLIANHQLSEKPPAPKTPRSILTSLCVAQVWNFASARNPDGFHCAVDVCPHPVLCIRDISLSSCFMNPARLSCLLYPSPISFQNDHACVCARVRTN